MIFLLSLGGFYVQPGLPQRGLDPTCCETCTPPKPCLEAGRLLGEAVILHQHQCLRIMPPPPLPWKGLSGVQTNRAEKLFLRLLLFVVAQPSWPRGSLQRDFQGQGLLVLVF